MILGFIVFWPLGLAILFWRIARNKGWNPPGFNDARAAWGQCKGRSRGMNFGGTNFGGSGNSAFDDWKSAELARLEEERRKLWEAQRAFGEHLDNLRRAKDRAEFDEFMAAYRNRPDQAPQA
jgi:hypothetical protein